MDNQQLLSKFNCKNIDMMSTAELSQLGLTEVPTILIVNTLQNGEVRQGLYEGEKAFDWVRGMVENRRQNMLKHVESTRKLIQVGEMKKKIQDGMLDFSGAESSGVSDDYSYWSNDTNIDQQLDKAQPKSFLPFRADNQFRIMTIPVDVKEKGYKLSKKDQDKLTEDLEASRKMQTEQIKGAMTQDHINSVINAENRTFQ
jgi:hypothetical protein